MLEAKQKMEIGKQIDQKIMQYIQQPSSKQFKSPDCNCKPKILIVDDNEFNMQPLKFFINDFEVDKHVIDIVKAHKGKPRKVIEAMQQIDKKFTKKLTFKHFEAYDGAEAV